MGVCQAVAAGRKDLLVVCNGYHVCEVIPSSSISKGRPAGGLKWVSDMWVLCKAVTAAKKDLLMVCNGYQVCGVMPSSSKCKERPAGGV